MRELSLVFGRGVRSSASLAPALEIVAHEANVLLGTNRTTIWLHDRRARQLVLTASSDPGQECGARVDVDDSSLPADGLRSERPRIVADGSTRLLIAPLRGWRRALGTLIVEGAATVDDEHLIELSHELGRHLAAGIENVQLLDEVYRQRRLLEDTFNSLADLVIVDQNPLENLKVLYGTGALKLNDATGRPEQVGGVKWTIKDGIVYDAKQLLADVARMVEEQKRTRSAAETTRPR